MGNVFCMTTPNTAAATGTPVKLITYTGVPLHALVAYERAALDLPHRPEELQQEVELYLASAARETSEFSASSTTNAVPPLLSLAFPYFNVEGQTTASGGTFADYCDGVPVWLQEVALLWDFAAAVGHSSFPSSAVAAKELSAQQQTAWDSGSTQQLRDFVASQKFAKALQHARSARHHARRRSASGEVPVSDAAPSRAVAPPQLPSSPLIFADLLRSYDALSRTVRKLPTATSSAKGPLADSAVTAGMWCVVLRRFLRSLPTPVMPALCSRRLEPVLAAHTQHNTAATLQAVLRVLRESFVCVGQVSYATFGFVVRVLHHHRGELTGGEVEDVAEAMVREGAVPSVVRAIAHACKPEARMFWPVKSAGGGGVRTMRPAGPGVALPVVVAAAATGAMHGGGDGCEGVGHVKMHPPAEEAEEEEEESVSSDGRRNDASAVAESTKQSSELHTIPGESRTHPKQNPAPPSTASPPQPTPAVATTAQSTAPSGSPSSPPPAPVKPTAAEPATAVVRPLPASRLEAPSLVEAFPVRPTPLSLRSHRGDHSATILHDHEAEEAAAAAQVKREAGDSDGDDDTLPSAVASRPSPTPLPASPGRSAVYPTALEMDATVGEETTMAVAEALRRALLPFSRPSSSEPATSSSPSASRSPSPENAAAKPKPVVVVAMQRSGSAEVHPLPAAPEAGLRITPRDVLQQDKRAEQAERPQQQQQVQPSRQSHRDRSKVCAASTLAADADGMQSPTATAGGQLSTPPNTTPSLPTPLPRARPLQAALLEAKLRFMAAPLHPLPRTWAPKEERTHVHTPWSTSTSDSRRQGIPSPSLPSPSAPSSSPLPDPTRRRSAEAARLQRVLDCGAAEGWSPGDLLAALQRVLQRGAQQQQQENPVPNVGPLTSVSAAVSHPLPTTVLSPTVCCPTAHHAAGPAGLLPELLSPNSSASLPDQWRAAVFSPARTVTREGGGAGDGGDGGSLADHLTHRTSTSGSLARLDKTYEFRKSGLQTITSEEGSVFMRPGIGVRGRPDTVEPTIGGGSVRRGEADSDSEGSGDRERTTRGVAAVRTGLLGSSLTTPADTTVMDASSQVGRGGGRGGVRTTPTAAWATVEAELRRLRGIVQALETSQFTQAREAAAQNSALAARCAELQRTQHEQAQQARLARARLTSVGHELEHLRDDRARLQLQLTTARQEGATLRDALVAGKLRA